MIVILIPIMLFFAWASIANSESKSRVAEHYEMQQSVGSFMAYRKAVIDYHRANPAFTGEISDVNLTPFYQYGYRVTPELRNWITSDQMFVYATSLPSGALGDLKKRFGQSLLIGRNNSGTLISASGLNTGIVVPAPIPNNAFLIVGK